MAKENTGNVNVLVTIAIIAILVAALIGALAKETQTRTTTTEVLNEAHAQAVNVTEGGFGPTAQQITVTNYPAGWEQYDCPLTNFAIKNQSGTSLTLDTDYTVNLNNGTYFLKNTTATVAGIYGGGVYNSSYVSYNYCADGYVNSSWGRSLLNMTPALIALGLLVAVIGGMYMLLRKEGVDLD